MRALSLMLPIAVAAVATAPVAAPAASAVPVAGTLSGVTGHAFVARGGRLLRAVSSMRLVRGDRVVTQADGSARVALRGGCTVAVGASASAIVGACGETRTADFARPGQLGSGAAPSQGPGVGTLAIALAGAASVVLGIVAATQNGGQPNSP